MRPIRFLLLAALALACAACESSKKRSCPDPKKSCPHALAADQVLRVPLAGEPTTLDPRQARDVIGITVCKMTYEGLTRIGPDGTPQMAVASSYEVSDDWKSFTFHLRDSYWSNGDRLTALDFERAWKSALAPAFPSDNANLLYPIVNAKAAKEGAVAIQEVGVTALDPNTLRVDLEAPTPYFLEIAALPVTFPVHKSALAATIPQANHMVCNGPFLLATWKHGDEVVFEKNRSFWDAQNVVLEQIRMPIVPNEHTQLRLFERGEFDWAGSPLGNFSLDAIRFWKSKPELNVQPVAGTYWFRVNTKAPPFENAKMRQAFALAIQRGEIIEHVTRGNQTLATGIVPPDLWGQQAAADPYFSDGDWDEARQLFEEALGEMRLTRDQLPPVTLLYSNNERNSKIAQAVQNQWKEAFGIDVRLEQRELQSFLSQLKQQDYQLSAGTWFADFNDPVNFLGIFKSADQQTNNTAWEDADYAHLLEESSHAPTPADRSALLRKAESLLINEMPVIPLFHYTFCYIKKPSVQGVFISSLGSIDFRWGYIAGEPVGATPGP